MKFSIVIPVYNVEKYLCECIDSILRQTFEDFELILVDDGSTDSSGEMCDKYANKDVRARVFHKLNSGAAAARNMGIKAAKGDYLVFVDADDYIQSENFLDALRKPLSDKEIDMMVYGCTRLNDLSNRIMGTRYEDLEEINSKEEIVKIKWLIENNKFSIAPWMHVVKRSFIERNNLYFNEEYKSEEDIEWMYRVYIAEPKIYGHNNCEYVYRIRENSLCHTVRKSYFWKNRYTAIVSNVKLIKHCSLKREKKELLFSHLAYLYYVLLWELWDEPDESVRKEAFFETEDLRFLMKYSLGKKEKICKMILSFCGIKWGSLLLNKCMHKKQGY